MPLGAPTVVTQPRARTLAAMPDDDSPFWPVPQRDQRPWDDAERARHEAEIVAATRRIKDIGHGPLPYLGDGVVRRINLLDTYSELAALAKARVEYLGRILADRIAALGYKPEDVLIGEKFSVDPKSGEPIPIEESVRSLVQLEAQERRDAAKLVGDGVKIGIQIRQAEAVRAYADTVAIAQQVLLEELGIDVHDEAASRAAMRAVLRARRLQGYDDGDPDAVAGPPLTEVERRRLKGVA